MFIEKYDLTLDRLLAAMVERPEEYRRTGATLEALMSREPEFRRAYTDIQRVIPDAVFPPTYFVVAGYRGIGSGSVEGPLISIEKKTVEAIAAGDIKPTLVHEMMHMQQLAALGEAFLARQLAVTPFGARQRRQAWAPWLARRQVPGVGR